MPHLKRFELLLYFIFYANNGLLSEASEYFPRFTRSTETGCLLPSHPKNGEWSVVNAAGTKWLPNMTLPSGRFIQIICNENYALEENHNTMNCINGIWSNEMHKCWKKCPLLNSTLHLHITCSNKNRKQINCSRATEGTHAEFRCVKYYEIKNAEDNPGLTCSNGTWEGRIPKCVLECGKNIFSDPSMVINGTDAKKGAYPWQVALYDIRTKELFCGGSLLNERVVLTAAHCVSMPDFNSEPAISVIVNNYHSQYNHPDDDIVQKASVQEIFLPERYQGRHQNYINDIAIIVTKEKFNITDYVRPVCVDWNSKYLEEAITTPKNSYVVGWGYTQEDGKPASVLQELKVRPIRYSSCSSRLPFYFKKYLTRDKLCAGHSNKSMAVCKGDSGGGLLFKSNDRFYITAIVSVAPASSRALTDSCDSQQYSLYTNVSYHRKFIAEKLAFTDLLDDTETCSLPDFPQFGYWFVEGLSEYYDPFPGHLVKSGTRLRVSCQNNFFLNGSSYLVCQSGSWNSDMGKCLKICSPICNTKSMKVHCIHPDGSVAQDGCVNATDGTVARFECAAFYEDFTLKNNPFRVCLDGEWDQTLPECSPACGNLNADLEKKKIFPWHVAIYNSINKTLICSGSLISERVIVTALRCVIDDVHNLKSTNDLLVTVGGQKRGFNDLHDSEYIQISEVKSIFKFESSEVKLHQDVAVIVAKQTFRLNERVLPICLDELNIAEETYLYLSTWPHKVREGKLHHVTETNEILKDSTTDLSHNSLIEQNYSMFTDYTSETCYGDIGAGMVFRRGKRHYLGGILTPNLEGVCNEEFHVYTKITSHLLKFILKHQVEFGPY